MLCSVPSHVALLIVCVPNVWHGWPCTVGMFAILMLLLVGIREKQWLMGVHKTPAPSVF